MTASLEMLDQSTLIYVADGATDVQVVSRDGADKPQDVATMFISDGNCGINTLKDGKTAAERTTTPSLVKKCVALRDGLRQRPGEVMKSAISVKAKP